MTLAQTEDEALKAAPLARVAELGGTLEQVRMQLTEQLKLSRSPMKSVDANVRRGLAALTRALDEKTSVHQAMHRNGLGWVDFAWGDTGTAKSSGKTKGAMGLSHILRHASARTA